MPNSFSDDFIPWAGDFQTYRQSPPDPQRLAYLLEHKPSRDRWDIFSNPTPGDSTPEVTIDVDDATVWRDQAMSSKRYLQKLTGKIDHRYSITDAEYWRIEANFLQHCINQHAGIDTPQIVYEVIDSARFKPAPKGRRSNHIDQEEYPRFASHGRQNEQTLSNIKQVTSKRQSARLQKVVSQKRKSSSDELPISSRLRSRSRRDSAHPQAMIFASLFPAP